VEGDSILEYIAKRGLGTTSNRCRPCESFHRKTWARIRDGSLIERGSPQRGRPHRHMGTVDLTLIFGSDAGRHYWPGVLMILKLVSVHFFF
jgi:hypothetical protein